MHQLPYVVFFLGWVWETGVGALKKKRQKNKAQKSVEFHEPLVTTPFEP